MNNVLILGGGGREHALAWKLRVSPHVEDIYVAPGNAGTAQVGTNVNIPLDNFSNVGRFVDEKNITLTVVGPEQPLADGIADFFHNAGLPARGRHIFGPTKGACVESSKVLQKDIMNGYSIPTSRGHWFRPGDVARSYIESEYAAGREVVIKADGLCAGKGVIVPATLEEALAAVEILQKEVGKAADRIVVEEKLTGQEASIMAFCDGNAVRLLLPSQDHKQVYDGDKGKNTGGMGAYAPAPIVTPVLLEQIEREVLQPFVLAMNNRGTSYRGIIYAGLMLTKDGPKVLEFNSRFGDPETQATLPLLQSDLFEVMMACVQGKLDQVQLQHYDGAACCVVMTAKGYPGSYPKEEPISGLEHASRSTNTYVFHAGTKVKDGKVVTNGGRVLGVTGVGATLRQAIFTAYNGVSRITWQNEHHRTDIAQKGANYGR